MNKNESVILIPVPEAEEFVSDLRVKYDPVGLRGIPAHITLLFPFTPPDKITDDDIEKLRNLFRIEKFDFHLFKINSFPGVVFVEPKEREFFINLTKNIYSQFPEYPPFEGKFLPEINPHLTIGHELGDKFEECLNEAKKKEKELPLKCVAKEIYLMSSANGFWNIKEKFTLL
jgi:2'-5' RNA ligase